jgi:hypothetical protein
VDGTIYGSIQTPSDVRLKENITSILNDSELTDKLFELNPIHYTYKYDRHDIHNKVVQKHYGFLAQDVKILFPELVSPMDKNSSERLISVNYPEFIPIMISKMKQMQHELDELKEIVKK